MVTMPNIPNLRHLRMLQTIGRTQSLGSAAREMNTSQPAVTLALSTIEADLGAAVFSRSGMGTFATPVGAQVLLRVGRFFEILEAAMGEAAPSAPQGPQRPPVDRLITATQIRALIAASEPRSIEAVARSLEVSVTALFRSARSLEKTMRASLFDRAPQGRVCNPVGAALARQFRCAARELDIAREEIRLAQGEEDCEIVIGALPMTGALELAEAARAFSAKRRRARIKILTGEYDTLLEDLSNCRLDIIFGLLRCPAWATDITKEELFDDAYCIAARPGHPLSRLSAITPADLIKYDWIVPPDGTPRRLQIEALFDGLDAKPHFNIETRSLATSRALLMNSDLITLMTRSEIRIDTQLGLVSALPCKDLRAIPPKGIATRANWLPTPVHAEFLDVLRRVTADLHRTGKAEEQALLLSS